jgi:ubiquinone/menaquinone biosynthesis C-methylase UbiE
MGTKKGISTEHTWDSIAESFDVTRRKPWEPVLSFLKSTSQVDCLVDLGCGNGRHLLPASSHATHVIGIDLSRKLLEIAYRHIISSSISNTSLLHASSLSVPLRSQSVDIILYIASLHNIYGKIYRIKSLCEVERILKPKGKALITVWSRNQPKFKDQIQRSEHVDNMEKGDIIVYWRQHHHNVPRFYHVYEKQEFIDDISQTSLTLLDINEYTLGSKRINDNYFAIVQK